MSEYCSKDDLRNRLTTNGILWAADRENGGDGSISAAESARYLDSSIQYGGNIVDGYICAQVIPGTARGQANQWLRDRCVDVAAYYAAGIGGRDIPSSLKMSYDFTMAELLRIKDGDQIPGYAYPGPANAQASTRTPRAGNWGDSENRHWGQRWR